MTRHPDRGVYRKKLLKGGGGGKMELKLAFLEGGRVRGPMERTNLSFSWCKRKGRV